RDRGPNLCEAHRCSGTHRRSGAYAGRHSQVRGGSWHDSSCRVKGRNRNLCRLKYPIPRGRRNGYAALEAISIERRYSAMTRKLPMRICALTRNRQLKSRLKVCWCIWLYHFRKRIVRISLRLLCRAGTAVPAGVLEAGLLTQYAVDT